MNSATKWPCAPIGLIAEVTLGKMVRNEATLTESIEQPYLHAANIRDGGILSTEHSRRTMWFSSEEVQTLSIYAGDVVVAEGGAVGKSAYVREDLKGYGFQNSILRIRPKKNVTDGRFIQYCLQSSFDKGEIARECSTVSIPHFPAEKVNRFRIPFPLFNIQQRIADYLDRETAEIDAVVSDLDRYVESMTSRMSLFVSNALNKDKHPAVPIFTFASISAGDNITAESIEESGDFPVYGGNGLRGFANLHNQQGDRVLIGRQGALCGNVHLAKGPFFASEHALVVAPHKKINLVWLEHALRDLNLRLLSQASAQPGISASEVSRQRVNLPPFEAQHAIAQRISNETERMNALIEESTKLRDLLLKRRSVLITEVVTGRKQV